jgi:N-ethylmaleimide reductase
VKQPLPLLEPVRLGTLELPNRLVMAPMARARADRLTAAPTATMAEYYAQRATAGLIVTEATAISRLAHNYFRSPGIYSEEQVRGWRAVVDAVHTAGGRIFMQLVHAGRATSALTVGDQPVAPSAIGMSTKTLTSQGFRVGSVPRELSAAEIASIIREYGDASRHAAIAGFDGVELHAANGYLLDQFLKNSSNQRTDQYGGSQSNRVRLLTEVLGAVCAPWDAERVGLRLSPGPAQDSFDDDATSLFALVIDRAKQFPLAYLHVVRGIAGIDPHAQTLDETTLRRGYPGTWITNNGYCFEDAEQSVLGGDSDLVAMGRPFIHNPDLVARYRAGQPLAEFDKAGVYGALPGEPDSTGYTDRLSFQTLETLER